MVGSGGGGGGGGGFLFGSFSLIAKPRSVVVSRMDGSKCIEDIMFSYDGNHLGFFS